MLDLAEWIRQRADVRRSLGPEWTGPIVTSSRTVVVDTSVLLVGANGRRSASQLMLLMGGLPESRLKLIVPAVVLREFASILLGRFPHEYADVLRWVDWLGLAEAPRARRPWLRFDGDKRDRDVAATAIDSGSGWVCTLGRHFRSQKLVSKGVAASLPAEVVFSGPSVFNERLGSPGTATIFWSPQWDDAQLPRGDRRYLLSYEGVIDAYCEAGTGVVVELGIGSDARRLTFPLVARQGERHFLAVVLAPSGCRVHADAVVMDVPVRSRLAVALPGHVACDSRGERQICGSFKWGIYARAVDEATVEDLRLWFTIDGRDLWLPRISALTL